MDASMKKKAATHRATRKKPTAATVVPDREGAPTLDFGSAWDYAPAPESTPVQIQDRYGLFIGGKFVKPKSEKYFRSINPATEKPLTRIAQANASDVDKAVKAARKAYDGL